MVHSACQKVLLTAGFTPDDYLNDIVSLTASEENMSAYSELGDDDAVNTLDHIRLIQQQESDMNYTQQATKRSHCKRLAKLVAVLPVPV